MTAPTGWWCPNCGHTVDAHAGDQPDPEPATNTWQPTPSPREVFNSTSAPVGVPVGDDTPDPKCGWCGHAKSMHGDPELPDDYGWCQSPTGGLMLAPDGSEKPCGCLTFHEGAWTRPPVVGVPVGDDTPTDDRNIAGLYPPGRCSLCGTLTPDPDKQDVCDDCYDPVGDDTPRMMQSRWSATPGEATVAMDADDPAWNAVGDDTPAPKMYECTEGHTVVVSDLASRQGVNEPRCPAVVDEGQVCMASLRGPVGDDTPAPTADCLGVPGWLHVRADKYEDLVRRAEATPDLTALDPEAVKSWLAQHHTSEWRQQDELWSVERVLAAVAALVRSAQNDTDGGNELIRWAEVWCDFCRRGVCQGHVRDCSHPNAAFTIGGPEDSDGYVWCPDCRTNLTVPVGDDTPAPPRPGPWRRGPTEPWMVGPPPVGEIVEFLDDTQSDGTPAPTGQWTADPSSTSRISRGMDEAYVYAASAEDRESLRGEFLVALNRAGATPDLTAQQQAVIDAATEWAADEGDGIEVDGQHQSTEDLCDRLAAAVAVLVRSRTERHRRRHR